MSGLGVAGFVIAIVLFFIAVLITRWIFGIGKILNLLTVIAQELRARNAVDNVDARLDQMDIAFKYLNHFEPKNYRAPTGKTPDLAPK